MEIDLPDTDSIRRMRADTYAVWAKTEIDFGFAEEGRRLKEQAINSAHRIGHRGMREELLAYVENLFGVISDTSSGRKSDA